MKKTEAISILATSVRPREAKDRARYDEAVRMAIEALKCSETPKSSEQNAETAQADHIADISKKAEKEDCISRQAAIDDVCKMMYECFGADDEELDAIEVTLRELPAAQPERDIPIKPNETTDTAWGIPHRQAVCPKCDYFLGHVVFLGDGKGRKVTYCETCGQAIDWEGWDFDE